VEVTLKVRLYADSDSIFVGKTHGGSHLGPKDNTNQRRPINAIVVLGHRAVALLEHAHIDAQPDRLHLGCVYQIHIVEAELRGRLKIPLSIVESTETP